MILRAEDGTLKPKKTRRTMFEWLPGTRPGPPALL